MTDRQILSTHYEPPEALAVLERLGPIEWEVRHGRMERLEYDPDTASLGYQWHIVSGAWGTGASDHTALCILRDWLRAKTAGRGFFVRPVFGAGATGWCICRATAPLEGEEVGTTLWLGLSAMPCRYDTYDAALLAAAGAVEGEQT